VTVRGNKAVKIGTQRWMAENLNYEASGKCYGEGGGIRMGRDSNGNFIYITLTDSEIQANCEKYGRLYYWNTAMGGADSSSAVPSGVQGVCPVGWHLPSDAEWNTLADYVGGSSIAGKKLMSETDLPCTDIDDIVDIDNIGLINHINRVLGTNDYGFSALYGGYAERGSFSNADVYGNWWSTGKYARTYGAGRRKDCGGNGLYLAWGDESTMYSVRCVED